MPLPSYRLHTIVVALALAVGGPPAAAQTTFCPDDPPVNPFLADSPYPTYHRNGYRQASTCLAGPRPGDSLRVRARTNVKGGSSPWVYLSDRYPDGRRALYFSNATHAFKFVDDGDALRAVDSLRIDRDAVASFGWNMLLRSDRTWYTYDPRRDGSTLIYRLGDAVEGELESAIVALDTLDFADVGVRGRVQHYGLTYDGNVVFNAEPREGDAPRGLFGVLSPDLELLDTVGFATAPGEITWHNAIAIAEDNSCYITTTTRLIRFDWDGARLRKTWEAAYDFVADGPRGGFSEGSGTTPTLLGWGPDDDKLVVFADGHRRNNLVAFWRELPAGWTGRPGHDRRFADSIRLPAAVAGNRTFQSIENSPTARGYAIAVAQFNGFLGYDCDNLKGVQRVDWDPGADSLRVEWVNREVNMNGILTYSAGSNLVYSSGKELDCAYYLYGLDWDSGETVVRQRLGPEGTFVSDPFYDPGNALVVDEDGTLYYSGGASLVAVDIVGRSSGGTSVKPVREALDLSPNPTRGLVRVRGDWPARSRVRVVDTAGRLVQRRRLWGGRLYLGELPPGTYVVEVGDGRGRVGRGVVVRE